MTQSQITAARAELVVKESAINYEIGELNAQIWALKQKKNSLMATITGFTFESTRLLRLETELKREGEWKG